MKKYLTSTTLLIGLLTFGIVDGNSSIPRSNRVTPSPENRHYPPWNPSPSIDEMGFLMGQYTRVPGEWESEVKIRRKHIKGLQKPAMIRQVPGDGNCLFHSISMCYAHAANGTHVDLRDPENLEWLYENSACLREKAVNCLEKQKLLFLQGSERVTSENLVQAASQQYGISDNSEARLQAAIDGERMTTEKALGQIQRVMRQQSPNRPPFSNQGGPAGVNNYAVVSNLERLEASTQPPTLVPQNSSPLRQSGGNPFR